MLYCDWFMWLVTLLCRVYAAESIWVMPGMTFWNILTDACPSSDFLEFVDAAEEFHPDIMFYATFNAKVNHKIIWYIIYCYLSCIHLTNQDKEMMLTKLTWIFDVRLFFLNIIPINV